MKTGQKADETPYVGRTVRSKEGPRHVTGRGRFTDDYRFPGLLHAKLIRSLHAHARIVRVDAEQALAHPGVVAVLTPQEVKAMTRPFSPGRYAAGLRTPIMEYATAIDTVRYQGEPVAAVVARDAAAAEDALELITVEYDPLPAVTDTVEAVKPDAPLLFEELGSNVAWEGKVEYGKIDTAFREADRVVRERLKIHRYSSVPLETFACVASFDAAMQSLTVWCTAQVPEVIEEALREALDLSEIRIIIPDIGGGFGQKIHLIRKYVLLTALLSIKTGRPVKWIEDRTEHMLAAGHSCGQEFEIEAAVRKDGTVLGLKLHETDDVGGSTSTLTIHFTNKLNNLFNTYATKHLSLEGRAIVTNKCPVVPNRGIGKPSMCFVWERTMDRVAVELGMSPIEVRRVNLIRAHEFPYEAPNGNIYDSGDYEALLRRALEKAGYEKLREEQKQARAEGRFLGIGVAMGVEPGGRNAARDMAIFPGVNKNVGAGGVNGATIKLERNGAVALFLASPTCGQFHGTTASQVVADVLGVRYEQINVVAPFDSELAPWGTASANSGNNFHLYDIGAVHGAAVRLREKILTLGAHLLGAKPEELMIAGGSVRIRGSEENGPSLAEIARIAYGNQARMPEGFEPGLLTTYFYSFPHAQPYMVPDDQHRVRAQFTFSAAVHVAVVEVDPESGDVHVRRYLIVSDNGTLINPDVVNGQIYGSAAHGISVALGEGFVYGPDGTLFTVTLSDYGKSSTMETPPIEVEHCPVPSPFTTLGQKAAGEGGAIPSPAAIASAVEDALRPLGIRIQELPLTPEVVWRLIRQAQGRPA